MSNMNVLMHNMQAMFTNRQLGITNNSRSKSSEKLSSGYRINRAADDAAGLTISEKLRHKVRSLNQGAKNIQDGISLVQIADGALAESQDILQRINELSIKSANGTNTQQDREAIQSEVSDLKEELDRIAHSTSFNEKIHPLLGDTIEETTTYPTKKITVSAENISFDNIKLFSDDEDVRVSYKPFRAGDPFDHLDLEAFIDDPDNKYADSTYNLIYGEGSTSHSRVRIIDMSWAIAHDDYQSNCIELSLSEFSYVDGSWTEDLDNRSWSRAFEWKDDAKGIGIKITQTVQIDEAEKTYNIKNKIENTGETVFGVDFLMNFDTAYNNNDRCEAYYTDGNPVENFCVYQGSNANTSFNTWADNSSSYVYDNSEYPSSLSIVNQDLEDSLPFSEVLSFESSKYGTPTISIGDYYEGSSEWEYFKEGSSLTSIGDTTRGKDKAISIIWSTPSTVTGLGIASRLKSGLDDLEFSFSYGVKNIKTDPNIPPIPSNKWKEIEVIDEDAEPIKSLDQKNNDVWIQGSDVKNDGINIKLVDATCKGIGMEDVDVSTREGALKAIGTVKDALGIVSGYRSQFGAYQNRLEHSYAINQNTAENTDDAESRIRDTDMAEEMMRFTKEGILQQAGQSMLSQANQNRQGILSLLQ